MNNVDLFNRLPEGDQMLVLLYFGAGVLFMVFMYLIYNCQFILSRIRYPSGTLMFAVGFLFLSTAGKALKGTDYNLVKLTQWAVIFCTAIALWVVIQFLKWNRIKQLEKEGK